MNDNAKNLAALARELDSLNKSMTGEEYKAMSAEELEQILGKIRDIYHTMEKGLNSVANAMEAMEGMGGDLH